MMIQLALRDIYHWFKNYIFEHKKRIKCIVGKDLFIIWLKFKLQINKQIIQQLRVLYQ